MKLERKRNAIRNIELGLLNKAVTIVFPFILRTVLIRTLGEEYLGLSSLFTSVLQVLSLTELGLGSAMVFNLYQPIADGDSVRIRSLVFLYKHIYRAIGLVILTGGVLLLPFLRGFVHGNYPDDINIYLLYIIYLTNTVISYFTSAYKSTILSAYQRRDVISTIGLLIHAGLYLVQIFCLLSFQNYYMYVVWLPLFTIIERVIIAKYVNKTYPEFVKPHAYKKEDFKIIFSGVKDLFGHKLSQVVTNSVDTIVISSFLGLQMVTIYNNYYYLMSAISGVLDIIYQAILAGIGNSLATEKKDKNLYDFKRFTLLNTWLVGWCSTCFFCLYQPMMRLWMGENLMLGMDTVVLLVIYFYVWKIRQTVLLYKDAAGMWHRDRWRPYVEIIVNIIVNIILVQIIGLNGILISTIVSMAFISLPWETYVFFKSFSKHSLKAYYKDSLFYVFLVCLVGGTTYAVCIFLPSIGIPAFVLKIFVCVFLPNVVILFLGRKNKLFQDTIAFLFSMLPMKGDRKIV